MELHNCKKLSENRKRELVGGSSIMGFISGFVGITTSIGIVAEYMRSFETSKQPTKSYGWSNYYHNDVKLLDYRPRPENVINIIS